MKSGFPKGNPDFFYVYGVRDMNAVSVQKYLTSVFYARALRCLNKIGCRSVSSNLNTAFLFITALSFHYFFE